MTYQEFKAKYPVGLTVSNPEGSYAGQCVSYVRRYMLEAHGVSTGPLGNAVDFATNPTFLKYYEKVATPQVGDIMIWGDDPGTWTGQYGHIAIFDGNGYMMNQNYNGSLKVSRNAIFTPGFIGYYRKKGQDEMTTKEDLEKLWAGFLDRPVMDSEYKEFVGRPLETILDTVWKSPEFKTRMDGLRKMWQEAQSNKSAASALDKLEKIKAIVA